MGGASGWWSRATGSISWLLERTLRNSTASPNQPAAAAASDLAKQSQADHRIQVLENIVFAQRWDLDALTEQRDELIDRLGRLADQQTALRAELGRLRADIRNRRTDQQFSEQAHAARAAVAIANARATAEVAADLVLLRHNQAGSQPSDDEPSAGLTAAVVAEVMMLQASGLFDHDFYLRQVDEPLTLAGALCHYVLAGEAAGRLPNPLFDLECYGIAARRADAPYLDRFNSRLAHYAAVGAALGLSPGPLVDRGFCLAQIDAIDHAGFEPISYYLQVGRYTGFTTHPLIDRLHYLKVRGGLGVGEDPLADYLLIGAAQGLSLHPLFDAAWYLETNEDVRNADCDPLRHYLAFGDAEGRWPNPLFDPAFYRRHTVTPVPDDLPALTHYVLQSSGGVPTGARTHPLFDGAWYLRQNEDVVRNGLDPLVHYFGSGSAEARAPHPLFDTRYLQEQFPLLLRHHKVPVLAFLRSRAHMTASPHKLFDPDYYLAQVPEAADAPGGLFLHFLTQGAANDADPHPLFCTRFYREQRAQAAAGDPLSDPFPGETNALTHYLLGSGGRGPRPHPLFDPRYYLAHNPDVRGSGISPLVHFMSSGGTSREHRQPHALFDIGYYAAQIADLGLHPDTNLLLDFLTNWRNRPSPHPLFDLAHYEAQHADAPMHPNPLADYAWKGRAARRSPHLLFDPGYYQAAVDVAGWSRTLLEHYGARQAPESFLPHPALDGECVLALIGDDLLSNPTLLEQFVTCGRDSDLSPHVSFASRDYGLLHPGAADTADDDFTAFLRDGGAVGWVPADRSPAVIEASYQAAKEALCGIGGLAPVSPMFARSRELRHRLPVRAVTDDSWRVAGALPAASPGARLAIYAAASDSAADPLRRHTLAALSAAGFTIVLVEADNGEADWPEPQPRSHVQLHLRHRLGNQHIGAYVLACRLFSAQIAAYSQVLFLSDNLVGPLGPMDRMLRSLAACGTGWWAVSSADQSSGAVDAELFALSGAVIAGPAFQAFVASFCFADTVHRVVEPVEHHLSSLLRGGGLTPSLMVAEADLSATWLHGLPAKQRWFRDWLALQDAGAIDPAGIDATLDARICRYADHWLGHRVQDPTFSGRLRPGLLFWDTLLLDFHVPFLRRDLLTLNPINDPALLRLRDILPADQLDLLHRLIGPTLPDPADLPHPPVLRLGRRAATDFTTVPVAPA